MRFAISSKRDIVSDPNIIPLINILLVLLVIFMLMPHSMGLQAQIPQPCETQRSGNCGQDKPQAVVIQVLANGSLRINQEPVFWDNLDKRLREIFKVRADRTAFIWGDASVEFGMVARVIDALRTAEIGPIGLLTQNLGNDF